MNLSKAILIYKIQQYQSFSLQELQQCIDQELIIPKHLILPVLLFKSNIHITSFIKIKTYTEILANQFFQIMPLNSIEQKWYKFYMLLQAYKEPIKDQWLIINEYRRLPIMNTIKPYMQEIKNEINNLMPSYYLATNQNINDVIPII